MILNGFKEMIRKRYSGIKGISYDEDVSYDCGEDKKRSRGGSRNCRQKCVTYQDEVDETNTFTLCKRGNKLMDYANGLTWDDHIKKVKDKVVTFLFDQIAVKINKYFKPNIFLKSLDCKVPAKIRKEELKFDWPKECFGDERCLHPADKFGTDYVWCYVKIATFKEDSIRDLQKIDFEKCMPKLRLPARVGK